MVCHLALPSEAIARPTEPLARLAKQTGVWHHQIRAGGRAISFAQSRPLGPDPENWTVDAYVNSPLAGRIDTAILWVDKHVPEDDVVRLLSVPAYHLHAFWLQHGDQNRVLVVDMPPSFAKLQYEKLYTSEEFLLTLGQESHITGLIFP